VDTVHGRLGVLICYDIHFEVPKLKAMGVDTLLFSSAWFDTPGSDFFQTQLPEMAREFEINIVAANWAVSKRQRWHGYGGSAVIDRKGKILAQAGAGFGSQLIVDCV
jgi:predicted amidohydrolase